MIAVLLMGGLGNQMFQYAAARSLALQKRTWVYLDPSFLYEDSKGRWTQREYELGIFNIQYKYERSGRIHFLRKVHSSKLLRRMSESSLWPFPFADFRERSSTFEPEIFSSPRNTYLYGYFQSEKYFLKHEEQIRKDFTFIDPPTDRNAELLDKIRNSFSISVHVRRGDYVSLAAAAEHHGLPGLDYYAAGIERILKEKHDVPEFYIFSDDQAWVKENIKVPGNATYVDWNTGKNSFEDMRLMSNCKHHIIANSSFSWWGAWLNPSRRKIVIAPKRWFAKGEVDESDIIPGSWIRL